VRRRNKVEEKLCYERMGSLKSPKENRLIGKGAGQKKKGESFLLCGVKKRGKGAKRLKLERNGGISERRGEKVRQGRKKEGIRYERGTDGTGGHRNRSREKKHVLTGKGPRRKEEGCTHP